MQAHQSKHSIGGSTRRERERDVCSFCISSVFFTLGTRLRISKFVLIFAKKSDRTRCLAVSILEYNINWTERAKVFWLSTGRTK